MTLAKTYELVNIILKNKHEKKEGLQGNDKPWNSEDDFLGKVVSMVIDGLDNDIKWFNAIKKQIPPLSNCKHPKEMQDICDDQLYCMDCNEDL